VLLATLICSDEACAEEVDLVTGHLAPLDAAACDCGCTLVLLAVSECERAPLPVAA
jgi:hypothetical protein